MSPNEDKQRYLAEIESNTFLREEAACNTSYATSSATSLGRLREEDRNPGENRTAFALDRDRIVFSKGFFRLAGKTQVFLSPRNPLISNRMTHTIHVAQLSRAVARVLELNEDLVEAIALGHDIGHPPFGHRGERTLDDLCKRHGGSGFEHNTHSLRVLDLLEKGGRGLNLTDEVRNGVGTHCGESLEGNFGPGNEGSPDTLEGCVVMLCDRIAYVGKDIEDAAQAGIISEDDLPKEITEVLGTTNGQIIDTLIKDIIVNFYSDREKFRNEKAREPSKTDISIRFSFTVLQALNSLIQDFNYPRIYQNEENVRYAAQTEAMLKKLFETFLEEIRTMQLPSNMQSSLFDFKSLNGIDRELAAATLGELEENTDSDREQINRFKLAIIKEKLKSYDGRKTSVLNFLSEMNENYILENKSAEIVRDYVASMTDNMAISIFEKLTMPKPVV